MSSKESSIVVKENNRQFVVVVPKNCDADSIHIDIGNCETGMKRCDYAIRVTPTRKQFFYYVELKGSDVVEAAKQLVATAGSRKSDYDGYEEREAWVISGGWSPAVNTQFQVQKRIISKFKFELKHSTKKQVISLMGKVCEPQTGQST